MALHLKAQHNQSELSLAINADGNAPAASALLDVQSTEKGILIPRMTTVQRDAIVAPSQGLLIYDTTLDLFAYYTNTSWIPLSTSQIIDDDGDTHITVEPLIGSNRIELTVRDKEVIEIREDQVQIQELTKLLAGNSFVGEGRKFIWDSNNGAMRAGQLSSEFADRWDPTNIGPRSLAHGFNTLASGANSSAFGRQSIASGSESTAWGFNSTATTTLSTAWGNRTEATGQMSTAWGDRTEATGGVSTAWGLGNIASGDFTTAWGLENNASGDFTTAWGLENNASGNNTTAWGTNNIANATLSTVWGTGNTASGNNTTAWGTGNIASANLTTAWGADNTASGNFSTAWGGENIASAHVTTAWGSENTSSGDFSTAWGLENTASGKFTTASGEGNTANSFGETVIGLYATIAPDANPDSFESEDRIFTIGNGEFTQRSDALRIYKDGNAELIGSLVQIGKEDERSTLNIRGTGGSEILFEEGGISTASIILDPDDGLLINKFANFGKDKVGINRVASTYALEVGGNASKDAPGEWLGHSDRRLKKNINNLNGQKALDLLLRMQGVTYEWQDDKTGIDRPQGTQIGFVAQDLKEIFPDKVKPDSRGFLQTAYGELDPLIIESIKTQQAKITSLEKLLQGALERIKLLEQE